MLQLYITDFPKLVIFSLYNEIDNFNRNQIDDALNVKG